MKTSRLFIFSLLILLFSHPVNGNAETETRNFSKVDAYAKSIKGINDIAKLSKKLTAPFHTELEKVRSIFRWEAENIAYDTKEFHADSSHSTYTQLFSRIDPSVKNIYDVYDEKIAMYVLKNKRAICCGYADLFKALCDSSGIKCEVVNGTAKTFVNEIGVAVKENHAWNAVMIDGEMAAHGCYLGKRFLR